MIDSTVAAFFVLMFGVCIGSFLNVCIYRLPREESIVSPGSKCPACEVPVKWYDNIPIISFIVLGGKCRNCGYRITPRYFFVEGTNGLIWLWLWYQYGATGHFLAGIILASILLSVTFTDFETGYIPDELNFTGMFAGLLLSALFPALHQQTTWVMGLWESGLGLLVGGGSLLILGVIGTFIFKKDAMGGGDVKLLAAIGAFVGWKNAALIFLLAPIFSFPYALYMMFVKKEKTLPFGPFIAMAGAWAFLYGHSFWFRYSQAYGI